MALTPEQITETSLAALTTYADAAARIGLLETVRQTKLVSLLAEWDAVKRKYSDLTGKIAGYATDNAGKRLAVRNDIRALLGLPQLASEIQSTSSNSAAIGSSNGTSEFVF